MGRPLIDEHDFALVLETWASTGTVAGVQEMGVKERSSEPPRRAVREWREKSEGSKSLSDGLYSNLSCSFFSTLLERRF